MKFVDDIYGNREGHAYVLCTYMGELRAGRERARKFLWLLTWAMMIVGQLYG